MQRCKRKVTKKIDNKVEEEDIDLQDQILSLKSQGKETRSLQ